MHAKRIARFIHAPFQDVNRNLPEVAAALNRMHDEKMAHELEMAERATANEPKDV